MTKVILPFHLCKILFSQSLLTFRGFGLSCIFHQIFNDLIRDLIAVNLQFSMHLALLESRRCMTKNLAIIFVPILRPPFSMGSLSVFIPLCEFCCFALRCAALNATPDQSVNPLFCAAMSLLCSSVELTYRFRLLFDFP